MGCHSSKAAATKTSFQTFDATGAVANNSNDLMSSMMAMAMEMQQAQLQKQQQMVASDPECRTLIDRQNDLRSQLLQASIHNDTAGITRLQSELLSLHQNPKYIQMIMPSTTTVTSTLQSNLRGKKSFVASSGPANTGFTSTTTSNNIMPPAMTTAFNQAFFESNQTQPPIYQNPTTSSSTSSSTKNTAGPSTSTYTTPLTSGSLFDSLNGNMR